MRLNAKMFSRRAVVNFANLVPYALCVIAASAELCQISSISPNCHLLHQLELSMDHAANPCENIYAYACNNVGLLRNRHYHQVADEQVNLNLILVMDTLHARFMPPPAPPETHRNQSIFEKSYIYYKSCVNEKDTNYLRYLDFIKPGKDLEWPLMEQLQDKKFNDNAWPTHQFDVYALLGQLHSYGLRNVLVYQRLFDADSVLFIGPPDSRNIIPQSGIAYRLQEWGMSQESAAKYAQDIADTQHYWHRLYSEYEFGFQLDLMTYGELKQMFPYLATFLANTYLRPFPDTQKIKMRQRSYFEFLLNQRWSAKDQRHLCNYLMITFLNELVAERAIGFSKLECITDLRRKLDFPVNLLYYQYVYKPDELFYNPEIYSFFNRTFRYTVEALQSHWNFTKSDLNDVRAYMSTLSLNIGNFPRNLHTSQIEKFYENIPPMEPHNFYRNHLNLLRHGVLKSLLEFNNQSFSIINEHFSGSSSLSFYDAVTRRVILPFGMFQPPLYHHSYHPIFKWSSLGFELAYAIVRNAVPHALMPKAVHNLSSCMEQLQRDTRLVSYRVAYNAYRDYVKEKGIPEQPDFSDISWKKLFFLNIQKNWCIYDNSVAVVTMLQNDMDSEILAEAYQCPVSGKLNEKENFYDCYRYFQ